MTKKEMLESVLENNKDRNNIDKIIEAMEKVDRRDFVSVKDPYIDAPLSIGYGQTISQPTTVARMLSLLDLKKKQDVLEIGSGSGWNAALVAYLVKPGKVVSVERIKELNEMAQKNYDSIKNKLKLDNIEFVFADAFDRKGKIWKIKYDRIITTAAADSMFKEDLMEMGKTLLKDKGLLLFPTEEGEMELWQKKDKKMIKIYSEYGYSFVPLIRGIE
ncbi:MAG: methyltransferase domain-containing protein [Candidatus Pacearchaeota archaeon]